jgi:hypothetical protein
VNLSTATAATICQRPVVIRIIDQQPKLSAGLEPFRFLNKKTSDFTNLTGHQHEKYGKKTMAWHVE